MPNRRDFFRTVAGATAGMLVGGRELGYAHPLAQAAAPAPRREVSIGGRRIRVVDVHAHCVVPEVAPVVKGTPYEEEGSGGGARVLNQARFDLINKQGIDIQVLSINGFWWYGVTDRTLADRIVRAQNEGLSKWSAQNSSRFAGLASSSLQFPDLAAAQLEDGIKRLGLKGAAIGGHVNGESLSATKYDPFWAKAAELGALVFMHPGGADNILKPDSMEGPGDLGNIIGNPLETTFFLSKLIFDGTFDKFPNLKVCGAHGGGYLPSYFMRTDVACTVRNNAGCVNKKQPREYLKTNILADTMVFSEEALRHLVAEMGVSQVVYGTDNPLNWPVTVDLIVNSPSLSNADKEAILGGNLTRLLRLT
jgi:aminocarboxymuconate-semialdehyde decarboxylase